ncbi:hypothetical protein C7M84_013755 [Penaeus vannamei]|uniref:Uncharacterized protein n=1 Tax=Penaeus vannamei TaxID=6689 RepID=A0A3R7QI26_PENVA|nr:hypothetical protein C7M84_013755 [Penaeus vannamei]
MLKVNTKTERVLILKPLPLPPFLLFLSLLRVLPILLQLPPPSNLCPPPSFPLQLPPLLPTPATTPASPFFPTPSHPLPLTQSPPPLPSHIQLPPPSSHSQPSPLPSHSSQSPHSFPLQPIPLPSFHSSPNSPSLLPTPSPRPPPSHSSQPSHSSPPSLLPTPVPPLPLPPPLPSHSKPLQSHSSNPPPPRPPPSPGKGETWERENSAARLSRTPLICLCVGNGSIASSHLRPGVGRHATGYAYPSVTLHTPPFSIFRPSPLPPSPPFFPPTFPALLLSPRPRYALVDVRKGKEGAPIRSTSAMSVSSFSLPHSLHSSSPPHNANLTTLPSPHLLQSPHNQASSLAHELHILLSILTTLLNPHDPTSSLTPSSFFNLIPTSLLSFLTMDPHPFYLSSSPSPPSNLIIKSHPLIFSSLSSFTTSSSGTFTSSPHATELITYSLAGDRFIT